MNEPTPTELIAQWEQRREQRQKQFNFWFSISITITITTILLTLPKILEFLIEAPTLTGRAVLQQALLFLRVALVLSIISASYWGFRWHQSRRE